MQTSIATVSLSGGLAEKLEAIAAAGFTGVEIFESDLLSFNGTPKDVARMVASLGLKIVTFQPFRDFEGMPEPQRSRTFARAERKFDLMGELGCNLLMICSNVAPDSLAGVDRAAADFHELGERAQKRGIKVGYEALAWGRHVSDYRDSWEVVRRADHPAIGLTLDSFHIFSRKTDLKAIRSIPGDRIVLVQLADAPWLDMDVMSWSRHFRCFPGQGDFPLTEFMDAVSATGYSGLLSLEIFNDQFRAGSPRSVAVDGQRSLVYLMDQMRGASGALAKEAPQIPPRAKCLGVEFLEFAADDHDAAKLSRLFAGLGFRKVGEHKSKAVTRWSQGSINLVLNSDKEGFAHSHQLAHGPSVCAMCLKVDDASATLDRAEKLRDTPFRQAVGPGELEIPAVRGLGGSLLYFVDPKTQLGQLWDIDFNTPKQAQANGDAGLTSIDHISQSMQYEEMLTWLLFYNSLLDVTKTPQLDVIDPGGIVRSQVVQTADGKLRIALNASQSQQTLSSRFLTNYVGSGVQHIALATDNIVATVKKLRANGVELLSIPENYYDDLEARSDLPAEQLDVLRQHGVLYDRDDAGEYFQAYTKSFGDLFFFEIVERRGYKGFGAVNASIRLAAQSRETQV
ncbi:bifunctional sugar phosphate isomerase/epimerase/4-hydroxyphenylpyruvate dioxygenase family protein [Rhodoplanes sp. Z2-YC6860]|uniref:bifunctional sugar phosphate isomerase/epimerase/4-hydroxyphenylpyruvate dioxygenase family protein n=1 Tax=Rhodoplanes sp. Z2-YC6860 TaxID=674703 RepID=UPI00078DD3AF|nr:sugar phosphate isomerase/epimerase and 4-hydroxyphenylpyruvate domain-containing protein [Rhodoplanes sp. Z2-YC6860]AMN44580.1 4-hydroxyphenylpyruvate dioxygenase/hemolysin-like protein [Rhodoplanes sp. Z2-YC6860]